MSSLVFQGLKVPGKKHVNSETISNLAGKLSDEEKQTMLHESGEAKDWIVDTIRKFCTGGTA